MDVKFWAETDAYSNSIPYSFFPEDIFIIKKNITEYPSTLYTQGFHRVYFYIVVWRLYDFVIYTLVLTHKLLLP